MKLQYTNLSLVWYLKSGFLTKIKSLFPKFKNLSSSIWWQYNPSFVLLVLPLLGDLISLFKNLL